MKKTQDEPEIGSFWIDKEEGMDCIYQYMGIAQGEFCKGQMHLARYDWKTKTASPDSGTWCGATRFKSGFVPVGNRIKTKHCCGTPTVYPELWCDDCGYEAWDKARKAKGIAA